MPGGDHTGPRGQGPGTGRAAGYCAGESMPGYANPILGGERRRLDRGPGGGWGGRGRGRLRRGWRSDAPHSTRDDGLPLMREEELRRLAADLQCLEQSAERLRRRIVELDAQTAETAEN